jgi:hypothetical protein
LVDAVHPTRIDNITRSNSWESDNAQYDIAFQPGGWRGNDRRHGCAGRLLFVGAATDDQQHHHSADHDSDAAAGELLDDHDDAANAAVN